jgi:uncharacterized delta-60 repeat protein
MSLQIPLNKTINRSVKFLSILLIFLCAVTLAKAAGEVDPTFNALPSKEIGSSLSGGLTLQPDGKILIFGGVGSNPSVSFFQRLNPDGTVDASFNCTVCNLFYIGSALIQPDGKILVGGQLITDSGGVTVSSAIVISLNPDGSQDNTFAYPFTQGNFINSSSASVVAIQPDGKILVVIFESFSGASGYTIRRLNPNGSFDNSFTPISTGFGRLIRSYFTQVLLLPSGKILVSGGSSSVSSSSTFIKRYNSDGNLDSSFEEPTFSGSSPNLLKINDFDVLPDGSILVVGNFTSVNGVQRKNFVKLQPAGNVDLTFAPTDIFNIPEGGSGIELLPNGQILISTMNRFYRFNSSGTPDLSFNSPNDLTNIGVWMVDAQNRIVLIGQFGINERYARLNSDGSLDASFNPTLTAPGTVTAMALQPDGKAIVYGDFAKMNGVTRNRLARLNADGTTDATFNAGEGFNGQVNVIVVQPDGKVLVGGTFTTYNGETRSGLARLLADGTLDSGFTANLSASGVIYSIALQPEGKIIVGGTFNSINNTQRNGVARLNSNGTIDTTFNAGLGTSTIRSIVIQPDGKVLIGGFFSGINGFNRTNLVRVNTDGTLDTSFNVGNIGDVKQIELQTDGKYVVLSGFSSIARLNNNGTSDSSFQPPTFATTNSDFPTVNSILVESDNSIVAGGNFTLVNNIPRLRLARFRTDGRVDLSFLPTGANRRVYTLVRQSNAKIVVGGEFTLIGNTVRYGIARLISSPFRNITPFDFDGDGRADFTVFRPEASSWYILNSSNNSFNAQQFGVSSDSIAPADYDGDGRADIAVFRPSGAGDLNRAYFYIQQSGSNNFRAEQFGRQGDVPASGDWDGDGRGDVAVYRDGSTTGGQSYFFYRPSSQPGIDFRAIAWGVAGDKPVVGDYDADGRLDAAVFRPSTTVWYVLQSSDNRIVQQQVGISTDIPTPADFDGDGRTDFAVYRPSNGTWYTSTNPATNYGAVRWGVSTDVPVAADYDGDGRTDVAVFRPENGNWYVLRSTSGFLGVQWGASNDKPAPSAYVP